MSSFKVPVNPKFQNTINNSRSHSTSIFSYLDFTSPSPRIKIFGKEKYKNFLGAIISLIWFILLIIFSFDFILDFMTQNKLTVLENSFIEEFPKLNLNNTPIMVILQNNMTEPIDIRAWRVNFLYWINQKNVLENGTIVSNSTYYEIPAERCNQIHFGEHWELFSDVPYLENYYCLPKDEKYKNITLFGSFGDLKPHSLLAIYFSKCINNIEKNITNCYDQEDIENYYIKNPFINIKYLVYKTDHYDRKPFSPYVFSIDIPVSLTIYKREYFYFSNIKYQSDENLFIRMYKNYFFYNTHKHMSYLDFEKKEIFPGNFASINFIMTNMNKTYKRIYYKIPDLLADIGGLSRIIRILAGFINGYFYSTLFYVKLISSYFNFKQDNDNNFIFNKNNIFIKDDKYIKNVQSNENQNFINMDFFENANYKGEVIEEEYFFKPFSQEGRKNILDLGDKFISNSDKKYSRKFKKKKCKKDALQNGKKRLDFTNDPAQPDKIITNSEEDQEVSEDENKINKDKKNSTYNIILLNNNGGKHNNEQDNRIDINYLNNKNLIIFDNKMEDKDNNNNIINVHNSILPNIQKSNDSKESDNPKSKLNKNQFSDGIKMSSRPLISESLGIKKYKLNTTVKKDSVIKNDNLFVKEESFKIKSNDDKHSSYKKSCYSRKSNYIHKKYEFKFDLKNYFYCLCLKNRKIKDFILLKNYLNRQMSIDFIIKKIREIDKLKVVLLKSYQIPIFNSMPYKVINLNNEEILFNTVEKKENGNEQNNLNNNSLISINVLKENLLNGNNNNTNLKNFINKNSLFDYDYNSYILQDALTSANEIEKKVKKNNIDKTLIKFWECNEFEN